ncbi:MAG TPA: ABC transporter permease [Dehalococcoidia bacterium]|nr:ABC transporter permease [Dehalococcoidia bacterium]
MATNSIALTRRSSVADWRGRVRRLKLPWVAIFILTVMLVCAGFAPWLAPHDPTDKDILNNRIAPGVTLEYPLGTDVLGRDILSRLIYGARTTVFISLVALGTGAAVGTVLGLMSGYLGGWTDAIIMRVADAAMGFPTILVAMVIVVILGQGTENIIIAITVTVWARFSRMIRGDVMTVKNNDYVILSQIIGVATPVIILRHVFPNVVNTLMVITSLQVGQVILLEASLSFLGLGLAPGAPAWGIMVAEGRNVILDLWWLSLFPGVAITIVVMAFNFAGDWLRDTLDPKLRRAT